MRSMFLSLVGVVAEQGVEGQSVEWAVLVEGLSCMEKWLTMLLLRRYM